jgi:NhaA family Na+:H+ antiporter
LVERLLAPFRRFASIASAGGIVLLLATAVALAWANSPWSAAYHAVWHTPVTIGLGTWSTSLDLHALINDGFMAIFFFHVGLEIKREVVSGELKSLRTAALPIVAAVGGMVGPAALYAAINVGGSGASGWGIPMATDIAFALGILALLGDRVPLGLKVFLAALAIVDDIGAIVVITLFYSTHVAAGPLVVAAGLVVLSMVANLAGVRQRWAYGAIGLALWCAMFASGVHATVAGVLLAMTIPVRTRIDERRFLDRAHSALQRFDAAAVLTTTDPDVTVLSNSDHHTALEEIETLTQEAQPPLIRFERSLHGIVAFGIMPVFAFANAGVSLGISAVRDAIASPVALGVLIGLVIGKPVGIVAASWLAVRVGAARLPHRVTWRMISGAGALAGIGFTMALLIADLALGGDREVDTAKVAILAASTLAGVTGWLVLRGARQSPRLPSANA